MKAKLLIDGKEVEVEISNEYLSRLKEKAKFENKSGYERSDFYYYINSTNGISTDADHCLDEDYELYQGANYYSDHSVAENNARAERLMRQLRRFAVEHREKKIDWSDGFQKKYYIVSENDKNLKIYFCTFARSFGQIYFDSEETAQLAIDTFNNELTWYFTEYKDSL